MSDTRSVETSAGDIETAIELGLEQLGVTRESVIVEILEEPSRGLLGLGARQARVRLTTAARPRAEMLPPSEPESPAIPQPASDEPADTIDESYPVPGDADDRIDQDDDQAYDHEQYDEEPEPAFASESELDEDARVGIATLEELLSKMQIDATVSARKANAQDDEEAPWILHVQGNDLVMLVGRRGETLSALQYVTRLIASRELQRRANIVLDVEGYKSRREKQLQRLAARMAEQALQIGRTVSLEPMSPYERRIIHLALRDHPDVTTESVGEGQYRKVTIIPHR